MATSYLLLCITAGLFTKTEGHVAFIIQPSHLTSHRPTVPPLPHPSPCLLALRGGSGYSGSDGYGSTNPPSRSSDPYGSTDPFAQDAEGYADYDE